MSNVQQKLKVAEVIIRVNSYLLPVADFECLMKKWGWDFKRVDNYVGVFIIVGVKDLLVCGGAQAGLFFITTWEQIEVARIAEVAGRGRVLALGAGRDLVLNLVNEMGNDNILVVNEYDKKRLGEWGYFLAAQAVVNVYLWSLREDRVAHYFANVFDVVVLPLPWPRGKVEEVRLRQFRALGVLLFQAAFEALKKRGIMVVVGTEAEVNTLLTKVTELKVLEHNVLGELYVVRVQKLRSSVAYLQQRQAGTVVYQGHILARGNERISFISFFRRRFAILADVLQSYTLILDLHNDLLVVGSRYDRRLMEKSGGLGLKIGRFVGGQVKISHNFGLLFGRYVRKNRVDLTIKQYKLWQGAQSVVLEQEQCAIVSVGQVVVFMHGVVCGIGLYQQGIVKNQSTKYL